MKNLINTKTNEEYSIHDPKCLPFLKLLDNYQLDLLNQHEILDDDIFASIALEKEESIESLDPNEQLVTEIIKGDKFRELQRLIIEKDMDSIKTISSSFQSVKKMSIPIIVYSIIQNATECFKYLLINGNDPKITMKEQNKHENNSYKYEWDCMTVAIFYGRVEMIKILEGCGIEKGENPNHIEAAILSFRNSSLKGIIRQIKEKDETKIQELLNKGLFTSTINNNIRGGEYLINQGADINTVDIINQIIILIFLIKIN